MIRAIGCADKLLKIHYLIVIAMLIGCSTVSADDEIAVHDNAKSDESAYYLTTYLGKQCMPLEIDDDGIRSLDERSAKPDINSDQPKWWYSAILRAGMLPDACIPKGDIRRFWKKHPWAAKGLIPENEAVCESCGICPQAYYVCIQSNRSPEALKDQGYVKVGN